MIHFVASTRCPRVEGADGDIRCMMCGERRACGHIEVDGGRFDGRIIMLTCRDCGVEKEDELFQAIAQQCFDGYLDIDTGGPGVNGSAPLIHNGHIDRLDDWKEEAHADYTISLN